ncbi:hypothetical protein ACLOJK_015545 [Asimina triloba]
MISGDYNEDFPPITPHQNMTTRTSYRHTIPDPSPEKQVTPAEACINWTNTNELAQNKVLRKIETQQAQIQQVTTQTKTHLETLQDLVTRIHNRVEAINTELYQIGKGRDNGCITGIGSPGAEMRKILQLFVNGFQGRIKDWWIGLREYRQLQFLALKDYETVIACFQAEFLGEPIHMEELAREEYLQMSGDGSGENLVVKRAQVGVVPGWVTEQEVLSATPLGSIEARGNGGRRPVLSALGPDRLVARPGLSPAHISPANPHGFIPAQRKPNWPNPQDASHRYHEPLRSLTVSQRELPAWSPILGLLPPEYA